MSMFERAYLDRYRQRQANLLCRLFGHKWQMKLHDNVCKRCRFSKPRNRWVP